MSSLDANDGRIDEELSTGFLKARDELLAAIDDQLGQCWNVIHSFNFRNLKYAVLGNDTTEVENFCHQGHCLFPLIRGYLEAGKPLNGQFPVTVDLVEYRFNEAKNRLLAELDTTIPHCIVVPARDELVRLRKAVFDGDIAGVEPFCHKNHSCYKLIKEYLGAYKALNER